MIRTRLKELVDECFQHGVDNGWWSRAAAGKYVVEAPKHKNQGDFATNLALVLAGIEKGNPREFAGHIRDWLAIHTELISSVDIAGPGFVNIRVAAAAWHQVIATVAEQGERFGYGSVGGGRKVMVEFVSANPTGPLSIGHGRQAILGDSIARLLEATGHGVTREYYYNDAGRQMRILGESTRARYLELLGESAPFPEDGYQGDYIYDIARELVEEQGDALKNETSAAPFTAKAEQVIFRMIQSSLHRLGIEFDNYYNERSLYEAGLVDAVVADLRELGLVYEQEGATWFRASSCGQEQDRVIIKSSGEPTYRLPDIAYHREKFRRGFDWLINVLGSDHIATVPDVVAGLNALGLAGDKVTVVLHQFVTLLRDGKQVKMSTRRATFITVDELLDEVGADVVRFYFLMRKPEAQLEFDLNLAASQSQENPVYYVQYGYARLCSMLRQATERGYGEGEETADYRLLVEEEEIELLKLMGAFPTLVEQAALNLEPHRMIFYLRELAAHFHNYYNKHRVIGENRQLTYARLALATCLKTVFGNGLKMIGLNAPETM
jgi:arginyl-tRNA synthetase